MIKKAPQISDKHYLVQYSKNNNNKSTEVLMDAINV